MFPFLHIYLAPREAAVVLQGYKSNDFIIHNEVFPGTVLGPTLWNVLFKGTDDTVRRCLFRVAEFADDLTACRNYRSSISNDQIHENLREYKQSCNLWCVPRRVTFDASKQLCAYFTRCIALAVVFIYLECW